MKLLKNLLFIILTILVFSCNEKESVTIVREIIKCDSLDISVTKNDNIVLFDNTNPVLWKGNYNNTKVKISYTKSVGFDNETETLNFIFLKKNNCLKLEYAYKFYDGKQVDVSAITVINVIDFIIQDWESDQKFSGKLTYIDPHDKKTYTRKFWVELSATDFYEESNLFQYFSDCFKNKLPIAIDINNDGETNFNLGYEEIRDLGNNPTYSKFTMKLMSTDLNKNRILSPKRNSSPYFVIFEPPFSSHNTKHYFNGVKNSLDVFYEFDAPYQKYNYLLNNDLTYSKILNNTLNDYFLVSVILDGKEHFGWIKFKFISTTCNIEIIETYLNSNPNEHITVH